MKSVGKTGLNAGLSIVMNFVGDLNLDWSLNDGMVYELGLNN